MGLTQLVVRVPKIAVASALAMMQRYFQTPVSSPVIKKTRDPVKASFTANVIIMIRLPPFRKPSSTL
jgi:hypothetical protein